MLVILYANPRSFIWLSCKLTSLQVYKLTSCLLFYTPILVLLFCVFLQVDELTSLQVYELLVILYVNPRSFILCFLQVDELTSLQVDELLVILYANLRSLTWFFGRQLVHLSSCSLVHLFFFKYMFSCYFVSFLQVDKLTSLQVYELLVILYVNLRFFTLAFVQVDELTSL